MLRLMKLERRKHKIRGHILALFIIIVSICSFTTTAIYGTMQENTNTYPNIMRLMSTIIMDVFIVYSSVLMAKVLIEEYTKGTITIMFSYPIIREKLIVSKLLLVGICTVFGIAVTNLCCFVYLAIYDGLYNQVVGSAAELDYQGIITHTLVGIILTGFLSMVPFCVGMIKKSVSATIVSSVGAMCLIQVIVSETKNIGEYGFTTLICCILVTLCTVIIFKKKINDLDS